MLLYKFSGGMSLLISALLIYLQSRNYTHKKIKQIDAFISLIEYIKNQIECYMIPIDRILMTCSEDLISTCGLDTNAHPSNLIELMDLAVFYIDDQSIDVLYKFANDFGLAYKDEQIRACEQGIKELSKAKERISDKDSKDKKVHLAICLCVSFSLILILM